MIQFREGMQRTRDGREKRGESIYLIFKATATHTHACARAIYTHVRRDKTAKTVFPQRRPTPLAAFFPARESRWRQL